MEANQPTICLYSLYKLPDRIHYLWRKSWNPGTTRSDDHFHKNFNIEYLLNYTFVNEQNQTSFQCFSQLDDHAI